MYYLPRAASEADQRLMKRIDALNLAHPFAGSRMLRDMLNREGFEVGRRHVATLMERRASSGFVLRPQAEFQVPGFDATKHTLRIHLTLEDVLETGSRPRRRSQAWRGTIS